MSKKSIKKNWDNQRQIGIMNKSLSSIKSLDERNHYKAKSELIKHMERFPEDMHALLFYGQMLESEKNYEEATKCYEKVYQECDSNVRYGALCGLGDIESRKGHNESARKYYEESIHESTEEEKFTILSLVKLEKKEGHYEKAIEILDQAKEESIELLIEKVSLLLYMNKFEEGLKLALTISPKERYLERKLSYLTGKLLISMGKSEESKPYIDDALDTKRKDSVYCYALKEKFLYAYAERDTKTVIELGKELVDLGFVVRGEVDYYVGKTYQFQGEYKKACECYKKTVNAKSPIAKIQSAACVNLGKIYTLLGEYPEAEKYLHMALDIIKDENYELVGLVTNYLFNIYFKTNQYDKAAALVEKAKTFKIDNEDDLILADAIIRSKTADPSFKVDDKERYRMRQVYDYNERAAAQHIRNRHTIGNEDSKCWFYPNQDVIELMHEVKPYLVPENKALSAAFDRYFFDMEDIGYDREGNSINRIAVITIPGTTDIITMYPDEENISLNAGEFKALYEEKQIEGNNSRIKRFEERVAKGQLE